MDLSGKAIGLLIVTYVILAIFTCVWAHKQWYKPMNDWSFWHGDELMIGILTLTFFLFPLVLTWLILTWLYAKLRIHEEKSMQAIRERNTRFRVNQKLDQILKSNYEKHLIRERIKAKKAAKHSSKPE